MFGGSHLEVTQPFLKEYSNANFPAHEQWNRRFKGGRDVLTRNMEFMIANSPAGSGLSGWRR